MTLVKTYSRLRCFTLSEGEGWGEVAIIMNNDKQQQAHDLYFATDKTQQEIADILDVSRKTINGWIRKNRWDDMKAAARQMPSLILHDIYTHINAVNDSIFSRDEADRCPTPKEVQMLHKLLSMTRSIEKKHTGSYIEAFQELQLFIFNRDSDLAMRLREHIADYARGTLGDKELMARKKRKNNVLDVVATLGRQEQREMNEEEECNPDVTFCNHTTPSTPHMSDYVETRSTASPLAPDVCAGHVTMEQQCNPDVTFCNHTTPPTQHISDCVETRCTASLLAQDKHSESDEECNPSVTFCNPAGDCHPACPPTRRELVEGARVFTVPTNGDITPPQDLEECNKEEATQDVTSATTDTPNGSCRSSKFSDPDPHMRPSPFIDGDTVWILHPDHLESPYDTYGNKWGPMKMSYNIRYYPDVDPVNNKAA